MGKSTRFSACASLAAVGQWMRQQGIWEMVEQQVVIPQKVLRYKPLDKLLDALITILAGGHGLAEVNTRVKEDAGLQRAFGRAGCAEQSVVSDTLNACTSQTVEQMQQALQTVYRAHSQGYQHDYGQQLQVLDVDMSGLPAGRQGEGVSKGYFAGQKNRRGRQLGRVVASLYDEIVAEGLYPGRRQLDRSLGELVRAAEGVLDLTPEQRQRTLVRVDAGGGTDEDINALLVRDYQIMVKVKHYKRSAKLCRSVTAWSPDPQVEGRQLGWVESPQPYARATRQLAIRNRTHTGQWTYHVVVLTLTNDQLFWLARQPLRTQPTPEQLALAALHAYDLRSGGVDTSNKGSKQGLGLTRRNKRRLDARHRLVLLAQLAYNLITWTRRLFVAADQRLAHFGCLPIVRDLFHLPGHSQLDAQGHILQITLRASQPFAWAVAHALASHDVSIILGQI
jgi:hypothetical protein